MRRDILLSVVEEQKLDTHLAACPDCSKYSRLLQESVANLITASAGPLKTGQAQRAIAAWALQSAQINRAQLIRRRIARAAVLRTSLTCFSALIILCNTGSLFQADRQTRNLAKPLLTRSPAIAQTGDLLSQSGGKIHLKNAGDRDNRSGRPVSNCFALRIDPHSVPSVSDAAFASPTLGTGSENRNSAPAPMALAVPTLLQQNDAMSVRTARSFADPINHSELSIVSDSQDTDRNSSWIAGHSEASTVQVGISRQLKGCYANNDFVRPALPLIAGSDNRAVLAAISASQQPGIAIDLRLERPVTLQIKSMTFSELGAKIAEQTGLDISVSRSIAGDRVTVFCNSRPVQDLMRQVNRVFGLIWLREGTAGAYSYRLSSDRRSEYPLRSVETIDTASDEEATVKAPVRYRPWCGTAMGAVQSVVKNSASPLWLTRNLPHSSYLPSDQNSASLISPVPHPALLLRGAFAAGNNVNIQLTSENELPTLKSYPTFVFQRGGLDRSLP